MDGTVNGTAVEDLEAKAAEIRKACNLLFARVTEFRKMAADERLVPRIHLGMEVEEHSEQGMSGKDVGVDLADVVSHGLSVTTQKFF